MTLAHVDGTVVVVVRPDFEAHLLAGWGGRPGEGGTWGAVVGVGADADAVTPTLDMTLRLEVRRQHGGFRQGYFGPDYELARFRAAGPEGVPLAEAPFPDGFSVYGEAVVGWDAVRYGALGTGGTLLFPESMGTLIPGAFASMGLGVDNAR